MIQLKINNMDHKAVLTVPTDYERVTLALWTLGLDRDPEKYTLRQLEAEFTYTTEEESQMVRLIDPRDSLIAIALMATIHTNKAQQPKDYEHIDYISNIAAEECYVCGKNSDTLASAYWGEDNVGLINLNNFDLLYLGINRYGDDGEPVQEPAGVMLSSGLTNQEADSYAHAYVFPDNACASLQITGVQYAVDRESVQNRLCQACLDSINDLWFTDQPPAEYAIISFEDRTIRPLLNSHPWFASGNYGVDCEFKDDGAIDLLIHYCPNRYE